MVLLSNTVFTVRTPCFEEEKILFLGTIWLLQVIVSLQIET